MKNSLSHSKVIVIIAVAILVIVLAFTFTACLPKDSATLLKEVEKVIANSSDVTVTDEFALDKLRISLYNTNLGTVTVNFAGGEINLKREMAGKSADIEFAATGITMTVAPTLIGTVVNASAFKEVKFLARIRLRDNELSYYTLIEGLDKVLPETLNRIESSSDTDISLDPSAANIFRLFLKQPILGNYGSDGAYDKSAGTYKYTLDGLEKINNEFTRLFKMFLELDLDGLDGTKQTIEDVFGMTDIEAIANKYITYGDFAVDCTVAQGKFGCYFDSVKGGVNAIAKLDNAPTDKLIKLMDLRSFLSGDNITANIQINIKATSNWSLSAVK